MMEIAMGIEYRMYFQEDVFWLWTLCYFYVNFVSILVSISLLGQSNELYILEVNKLCVLQTVLEPFFPPSLKVSCTGLSAG